jgi:LPXTG-site transpeptidase (sortase) family protein
MRNLHRSFLIMQCLCLLASGILLVKPVYRWGRRQISHHQAAQQWEQARQIPSATGGNGQPALWLHMETTGFSDLVLIGDAEENLDRHASIAHTHPTVILGHRDSHFRRLKDLEIQDQIQAEHPDGTVQTYQVTETEILPAENVHRRILEHRDPDSLVLITCYPFHYIGPAPDRYLVWARPGHHSLL